MESRSREIRLPFTTAVAGVSFHRDALIGVTVGMRVTVTHEPDNPYDSNACAVLVRDQLIGHLPRDVARRMIARGERRWKGVVSEVLTGQQATGIRVRVLSGEPLAVERADEVQVRARSGRILGVLLERRGNSVKVRTDDGSAVDYPLELLDGTL